MAEPSPELVARMMKMYAEGATYTDIGGAIGRDPRYPKKYIQRETRRRTEETKEEKKTEGPSQTEAIAMIKEGRDLVDVRISTGLPTEEVEQAEQDYWKLKGLHRLGEIYDRIGSGRMWQIINLHEMIDKRRLDAQYCLDMLNEIHDLQKHASKLQDENEQLERREETLRNDLERSKQEKGKTDREYAATVMAVRQNTALAERHQREVDAQEKKAKDLAALIDRLKQDANYLKFESYVRSKIDERLGEGSMKRAALLAMICTIKAIAQLDDFDRAALFNINNPIILGELARRKGFADPKDHRQMVEKLLEEVTSRWSDKADELMKAKIVDETLKAAEVMETNG